MITPQTQLNPGELARINAAATDRIDARAIDRVMADIFKPTEAVEWLGSARVTAICNRWRVERAGGQN